MLLAFHSQSGKIAYYRRFWGTGFFWHPHIIEQQYQHGSISHQGVFSPRNLGFSEMKNIESLLDLAGQHVKKIKSDKADATACLADDVTRSQLDHHDDTTNLESILAIFFNPSEDKLGIRVSCAAFSFSLYTLASATHKFSKRITGLNFSNVMCSHNFF